jgi:hypothetical protein
MCSYTLCSVHSTSDFHDSFLKRGTFLLSSTNKLRERLNCDDFERGVGHVETKMVLQNDPYFHKRFGILHFHHPTHGTTSMDFESCCVALPDQTTCCTTKFCNIRSL